jgi:hypothetical protein
LDHALQAALFATCTLSLDHVILASVTSQLGRAGIETSFVAMARIGT